MMGSCNTTEVEKIGEDNTGISKVDILSVKRIPSLICDKLYLGGVFDSNRKETLKELGITHILVVGRNLFRNFPKDFTYQSIDIADEPYEDISKYFESSYQFINKGVTEGICFVHCAFGQSRSASIVIAYLMKENNWSYEQSYTYVKEKRRVVSPNLGFENQLRFYQVELGLKSKEEVIEEIKQRDLSGVKKGRDFKYFN